MTLFDKQKEKQQKTSSHLIVCYDLVKKKK